MKTPSSSDSLPERGTLQQDSLFHMNEQKYELAAVAAEGIAASAAEDKQKDNPQTTVIAASVTAASESIAASATEDKQKDNPQAAVISAASTVHISSLITSASTVCST